MPSRFAFALVGALAVAVLSASAQALHDPDSVVVAGLQIAKTVDGGRYAEVWESASSAMKKLSTKAAFVDMLTKSRQALGGGPTGRIWIEVSRREFSGTPELPAGTYANVSYHTTFSNGKTARELVSFRLDEDKNWRLAGYAID